MGGFRLPQSNRGVVAQFDGEEWDVFEFQTTGYSGAEPLDIVPDGLGRWWFATRSSGIDVLER